MRRAAVVALAGIFALIYLPDIGHGFIKDDFSWINHSRSGSVADLLALFSSNTGFYRPFVSVTFATDYAVWHLQPFGYAVTNFVLLALDALLLYGLARRFASISPAGATVAAAVWAFNFHGINMSLLWLSGRTSLLVTLFALATAHMMFRGRQILAGVCCLAALLCKEEAALLPLLFTVDFRLEAGSSSRTIRSALKITWPLWLALGVYALLRAQSGAFTPLDAPTYYQFSSSPALVARNLVEYADRACTVPLAVALVFWLSAGMPRVRLEIGERAHLEIGERGAMGFGALWLVATYATTVLLPIRSSLYAVLPSVGSAIIVGAFASAIARAHPVRFARASLGLVIVAALLIPVYRSRNERWVDPADASTRVLDQLRQIAAARPDGGRIVLVDSSYDRVNLDAIFGALLPDAIALTLGSRWTGEIASPSARPQEDETIWLRYANGELVR